MKIKVVKQKSLNIFAGLISIGCFLLLWQTGTNGTELGKILPGPVTVLSAFFRSFVTPVGKYVLWQHVMFSLTRVMIAYLAAAVSGILLGLGMGRSRMVEAIFRPLYEMIRPVPPIAWISISILWFGLGESAKYFIIFLGAFSIITYNSFSGVASVDPVLVGAAKMLGANERQIFMTVVLPASAPYIFSGMQVGLSTAWATVVAAEMVRSSEGVGWIIVSGMDVNNTTQILVGIMAIGVIGLILAILLRMIERRLNIWNGKKA